MDENPYKAPMPIENLPCFWAAFWRWFGRAAACLLLIDGLLFSGISLWAVGYGQRSAIRADITGFLGMFSFVLAALYIAASNATVRARTDRRKP